MNPPTKNWLTGHGGVAVLPPLPSQGPSSSSQPEDLPPPPAYKAISTPPTSRKVSPPPPYSSPVTNHRTHPVAPALPTYRPPPRVAPKPYSLPNPVRKEVPRLVVSVTRKVGGSHSNSERVYSCIKNLGAYLNTSNFFLNAC